MARTAMTAESDARTPGYIEPFWQVIFSILIVAAAIWIYRPAIDGDWLWDDGVLISNNDRLRSLLGLWEIWFTTPPSDYWPLTWTLLWVEWHLWGNEPLGYHIVNVALHVASAFLVWRLLSRLGLRAGWLGGLLFAIHPLAVESVAWVSEVKNTLSLPFYLLALDAWLDHEEGKPLGYLKSILYYLLAMLAKTSTVMLPAILLLYAWWKKGRITSAELKRIIPFAVIAAALGIATVLFQSEVHEASHVEVGDFFTRWVRAGVALFFYLGKFILPIDPLPIYPRWTFNPPSLLQIAAIPVLAGMIFGFWTQRKGWGRPALFGFGFFLLNLLPVVGFLKMKYMTVGWVADHFAYLPIIGLIGLFIAVVDGIDARLSATSRPLITGILAVIMVLFAYQAHWYVSAFTGPETLWMYEVDQYPDGWFGHNELGKIFLRTGRAGLALEHFESVIRLNPKAGEPYDNLGLALVALGRYPEAFAAFHEALRLDPQFTDTRNNLGVLLARTGHTDEAFEQFRQALLERPNYVDAHNNMGHAYLMHDHFPEAIAEFQESLKIDPENVSARLNLAFTFEKLGRTAEALQQLNAILKFDPSNQMAAQHLEEMQQAASKK